MSEPFNCCNAAGPRTASPTARGRRRRRPEDGVADGHRRRAGMQVELVETVHRRAPVRAGEVDRVVDELRRALAHVSHAVGAGDVAAHRLAVPPVFQRMHAVAGVDERRGQRLHVLGGTPRAVDEKDRLRMLGGGHALGVVRPAQFRERLLHHGRRADAHRAKIRRTEPARTGGDGRGGGGPDGGTHQRGRADGGDRRPSPSPVARAHPRDRLHQSLPWSVPRGHSARSSLRNVRGETESPGHFARRRRAITPVRAPRSPPRAPGPPSAPRSHRR